MEDLQPQDRRDIPILEPAHPPRTGRRGSPAPVHPDLELAGRLEELVHRLRWEIGRVVVGQDRVVEEILVALFAGGHVLLEGVPGLAKTLLVETLGRVLSLRAGRIQFTPDLMPADVTGTLVVEEERPSGARRMVFRPGPVFVQILLADEINRTPPKTQAALLEAMNERAVTAGGRRHALPQPFHVLATQNPIEQQGTYPLPEAQLDRFLLKVTIDYPSFEEEWMVLEKTTGTLRETAAPVLEAGDLLRLQRLVRALPVSDHVRAYAARLARASRPDSPGAFEWVRDLVAWGAGPRAAQALILCAKARALLHGRFAVTREDVRAVAPPALRHRVLPSFRAEGEGLKADDLVARLLDETPPFDSRGERDALTRRILRL